MDIYNRVAIVILAGGKISEPLSAFSDNRATIKINDKYIISYVVDAIKKAGFTRENIVAIVAEDTMPALFDLNIQLLPSTDSIVKNMMRGSQNFPSSEYDKIVFVTGDLPLLTSQALIDFIDRSLAADVTFTYPIISKEVSENTFANSDRTYVKIKDGEFTGGNLFCVNIDFLHDKGELIENIYSYRKTPLKLAGLLGGQFIFKYIRRQLSISEIEQKAEGLIGSTVKAIITQYPEIGFDVDKPSDLSIVEKYLTDIMKI